MAKDSAKPTQQGNGVRSQPAMNGLQAFDISSLSAGMPLLQRQCACGGGCPRCQSQAPSWMQPQKSPVVNAGANCQDKQALSLQNKLRLSEPGDRYEQEADRIAEQIMRSPDPTVPHQILSKEASQTAIQRKDIVHLTPLHSQEVASEIPQIVYEVLRSPGEKIEPTTLSFMESQFNEDFGQIRIQRDFNAAKSAESINSLAYTVGENIVFGAGKYAPNTMKGRQLLAHELAHVVQQRKGSKRMIQRFSCTQILNAEEVERVRGIRAHQVITRNFASQFANRAKGFRIPGATSAPIRLECGDTPGDYIPPLEFVDTATTRANVGIPDLAYVDNQRNVHLGEIKIGLHDCRDQAERQVSRYVEQGNMDDDEIRRYKNSPYMRQRLRGMGLPPGPLGDFMIMNPDAIGYTLPNSIDVDGIQAQVASCGHGVIIYKNIGEASENRHLCDQSSSEFIDRLIQPAEQIVDDFIDRRVSLFLDQAINNLSLEDMISLSYQYARPTIQHVIVQNFGVTAWQIISSLNDQEAVRRIAQFLEQTLRDTARQEVHRVIQQIKTALLARIRHLMKSLLRQHIERIIQQLCTETAAVSLAVALQAIRAGMQLLFQRAFQRVVEEVVLAAVATAIAIAILIIIAVIVIVVIIVLALPEILAALGIGGAAAGTTAAVGTTAATGTTAAVTGTAVTSTGITLTVIQGGATTTIATTATTSAVQTITSIAAAVLLALGLPSASDGDNPD